MKCNVSTEHTLKRMEYQCECSAMCVCLWYGMHLVVVVCARPCKRMYLWYTKYIYIYILWVWGHGVPMIFVGTKKTEAKGGRRHRRLLRCSLYYAKRYAFLFLLFFCCCIIFFHLFPHHYDYCCCELQFTIFFLIFFFFFLCVWIWEMRKCIGNVVRIVWSQQSHTLILMAGGTWIILFCRSMSKTTIRRDHSILENYFSAWHNNKHHCIVSVFVVFSISFFLYISIFLLLLLVRWLLLLLSVAVVKPAFYHIFNSISSDL